MEGANGAGSDTVSSSEDGQSVVRNMVKKEVQFMALHTLPQVIKPMMEELILKKEFLLILLNALLQLIRPMMLDLFRTVVKEEVQRALTNWSFGGNGSNTNAADVSNERRLRLKFLDEVPDDVLTGREIKGKEGTQMRVALVDEVTGNLVESGVESSTKVEILLLEASENDNEQNFGCQDFNSRIIKESDHLRPHFAKSYHVYLEKGIGELTNAKLAHDKNWKKSCTCRLGARAVSLNGVPVQEAWTKPFVISDRRGKLYEKHETPSLLDDVWRLVHIGKGGARYKHLKEIKVSTVKDFLFLLSVDRQRLQNKLDGVSAKAWEDIVEHAQKCTIDDTRICVFNDASSGCNMSVVFNIVGEMKGVILDSIYVPIRNLQETEKNQAHVLLRSAFDKQDRIAFHSDEMALMKQLSYQASSTSSTMPCRRISGDLTPSGIIPQHDSTQAGTSSPSISPSNGPSGNAIDVSQVGSTGLTTEFTPYQSSSASTVLYRRNSGDLTPSEIIPHHDSTQPGTSSPGISPSIGPWGNANDVSHVGSTGLTTLSSNPNGTSHLDSMDGPILSPDTSFIQDHLRSVLEYYNIDMNNHAGRVRFFVLLAKVFLWKHRATKRRLSLSQRDVPISKRHKT